jgi:hypothetical protein
MAPFLTRVRSTVASSEQERYAAREMRDPTLQFQAFAAPEVNEAGVRETWYETWLEVPIDDDRWTVAYRLVAREGVPVVAEVRVFPYDPDPDRVTMGRWSEREDLVPVGGLSTRRLRDVKIEEHLHKKWAEFLATPAAQLAARDHGLEPSEAPSVRGRRGRPPIDDLLLARVAQKYVLKVRDGGRHPVRDIYAEGGEMTYSYDTIRGYVVMGRKRGLLTESVRPGRAGGSLTLKAIWLLEDAGEYDLAAGELDPAWRESEPHPTEPEKSHSPSPKTKSTGKSTSRKSKTKKPTRKRRT